MTLFSLTIGFSGLKDGPAVLCMLFNASLVPCMLFDASLFFKGCIIMLCSTHSSTNPSLRNVPVIWANVGERSADK